MRPIPQAFIFAVACFSSVFQVVSVVHLRQSAGASSEATRTVGAGEAAKAFANKASARLRLLSDAAHQVVVTPSVQQEPLFRKTLHKVSSQLQESAAILQKWGADYARNADANEMAVTLAEKDEAYEAQDLKRQLRAAIEADQDAQLEQPKRLADLSRKVAGLKNKLIHLKAEEAHQKKRREGTVLISNVWPRPPKNATKAEIGLFMNKARVRVNAGLQKQEDQEHLVKLETRLNSLEVQLQEAHASTLASHADTEDAHREAQQLITR